MEYRPDIDGLRGVAVVSVVAYHAFPGVVTGGFIGVDIFFVISGFLISGILFQGLKGGKASLSEFYARRIRRIFPALSIVLAVALLGGWLLLFPGEYLVFGRDLLASAFFLSNIAFFREANYFDIASQNKPLLHLWSLGVEEQFYLIWPLIIFSFRRIPGRLWFPIAAIFSFSFLVNLSLSRTAPAAAFYLPITRFWELLAGAALAWLSVAFPRKGRAIPLAQLYTWLGASLIVGAALFLGADTPWPSYWAAIPTTGAALIILAGPEAVFNRLVLGSPVAVFTGLISYPLYLWHWILLVFIRLLWLDTLRMRGTIVAISFGLAWLTWRFIERPLRHRRGWATIFGLCACVGTLGASGLAARLGHGLARPLPAWMQKGNLGGGLELTTPTCGGDARVILSCRTDSREPPVFALMGDSHADALFPGLVRASTPGHRWQLLARAGCVPLVGIRRVSIYHNDDGKACDEANRSAIQTVAANPHIRAVLITVAARMTGGLHSAPERIIYASSSGDRGHPGAVLDGLANLVTLLSEHGKHVVFMIDTPALSAPEDCIDRISRKPLLQRSGCELTRAAMEADRMGYMDLVRALGRRSPSVTFFDPTSLLCSNEECSILDHQGDLLYSYTDHISDNGNGRIAAKLEPVIESLAPDPGESATKR